MANKKHIERDEVNLDILAFILSVFVAVILLKFVFKVSIGIVGVLFNSLVGAAILFVLNLLGLNIQINWFTSIIVGFLGIPGVVILVLLKLIFKVF